MSTSPIDLSKLVSSIKLCGHNDFQNYPFPLLSSQSPQPTSTTNRQPSHIHIRVSSILDDDDQFSQDHLIDGKLETCWNSDEGDSQFVLFKFSRPVDISHFELTFQGGFGANHIDIYVGVPITSPSSSQNEEKKENNDEDDGSDDETVINTTSTAMQGKKRQIGLKSVAQFTSQDASSTQSFRFVANGALALKISFSQMADMFGRVIIYNLNIFGQQSEESSLLA